MIKKLYQRILTPKTKLILSYLLEGLIIGGVVYSLTYLPTRVIILVTSGIQIFLVFLLTNKIKRLERNQKALYEFDKKAVETIMENQKYLSEEIRSNK